MIEIRACSDEAEAKRSLGPISHYFGGGPEPEWAERILPLSTPERFHVAWDGDSAVGGAGVFPLELTVPGGVVPTCGTTTVGVLPTHRRRGILSGLMRAQLDDAHERGEPLAALWASEGGIYGRYGFGVASLQGSFDIERNHAALRDPAGPAEIRLVGAEDALDLISPIHDEARGSIPGTFARSRAWWELRRMADSEGMRQGGGELVRAVLEIDGRPAGYALYRVHADFEHGSSTGHVHVIEALAATPQATHALWQFLLGIDWLRSLRAFLVPHDHPLFLLAAESRRLNYRTGDGLWVRLLDVGAALSARSYAGEERVVLDVRDEFCPWNEGRWALEGGAAERTDAEPDLRLAVADLATPYLGGFTFADLARACRVEELTAGAIARADALFRTDRAPWCPEIF
jgi:predicted acetyltransferase